MVHVRVVKSKPRQQKPQSPVLSEPDRAFLKGLDSALWSRQKQNGIVLESDKKLTKAEWDRVGKIIVKSQLVCEMFTKGMFGGYGMDVYEQPAPTYPGVPLEPVFLLRLIEDNLPAPKNAKPKTPGCGLDYAWNAFSKFTHSEQNKAWLKEYNLAPSEGQSSYWY